MSYIYIYIYIYIVGCHSHGFRDYTFVSEWRETEWYPIKWYSFNHFWQNMLECVKYIRKIKYQCWNMFCVARWIGQNFYIKVSNILSIKNRKFLTFDRKRTSVGTIPITLWYISDHRHLPQMNRLLPFASKLSSWYQTLHFWQQNKSPVFIEFAVLQLQIQL